MPDVVVKHGDTEFTVPIESVKLPDGFSVLSSDDLDTKYVARDAVKKDFVPKSEFQRRLASVTDKAHEDETVIARVLEAHGQKVPDVGEMKAQWEKANLSPLKEKYSSLRDGLKKSAIREAAKEFFDERFVTPLPDGSPSPMEIALAPQFDLDDVTASIYPVGTDGKPFIAANPDAHNPYRTTRDHLELIAKDPRWEPFLRQERRNSGGSGRVGQDGQAGGSGSATRKSDIPSDLKAAWIKQHGYAKYKTLPE